MEAGLKVRLQDLSLLLPKVTFVCLLVESGFASGQFDSQATPLRLCGVFSPSIFLGPESQCASVCTHMRTWKGLSICRNFLELVIQRMVCSISPGLTDQLVRRTESVESEPAFEQDTR